MSGPRPAAGTVVCDLGGVLIDWNPRQDAGRPWDQAIAEPSARLRAEPAP